MKLNPNSLIPIAFTQAIRMPKVLAAWVLAGFCVLQVSGAYAELPPTPELPAELKDTSGHMILLDFFSPSCGACMMMEPHIERLREKTEGKVTYRRLDLSDEANTKYMKRYEIKATPTYLLFNHTGKPVYRMEALIVPTLLEKQVLRETGQLNKVDFPSAVLASVPATPVSTKGQTLENLLLVAFENADCTSCKTMAPYLAGFEMAGQDGLSIIHVDAESTEGQALVKSLSLEKVPAFVLFDNANDSKEELVRLEGAIKPKDLWNIIRLFGSDGLTTPLPADPDEE